MQHMADTHDPAQYLLPTIATAECEVEGDQRGQQAGRDDDGGGGQTPKTVSEAGGKLDVDMHT